MRATTESAHEAQRLREELETALGDRLTALAVHGSAARGEHLPGRSNLDVVVVLREASPENLATAGPVLAAARRRAAVAPFVLAAGELDRVADVFPLKLRDIQRHHVLLKGDEPLVSVEPTEGHQRLRVEQSLRNHLLRLRRTSTLFGDDPAALRQALRRGVGGLRVELEALCGLSAKPLTGSRFVEVFDAASEELDLPRATLTDLEALRRGDFEGEIPELAAATQALLERAVRLADQLDEVSP